jgi:outer membrane receptor protein involved in Fe transport
MRLRNIAVLCLSTALIIGGDIAYGQGIITGSLGGTITDSSGAVVPGAPFTVKNVETGASFTGKTNGKGELNLDALPVGTYTVTVQGTGFAPLIINGITVRTGEVSSLGSQMLSVNATEQVTVNTSQNLLQTEQAQLTTTIDSEEITDLPTGGGLDRLVLLVPGVVRTLGNNYANTNGTGLSSNGLRGRSNNFEIDGQTNNDNSVTGPQFFFHNEDALGELQIITNNFGAQYGRNAGQVVNYITKSGTNTFHGTAFENYVGSWGSSLLPSQKNGQFGFCYPGQTSTTALPCSTPVVPRVTANEYGGTIGGPILHDKLFAFGSTLWREVTNGASPTTSTTLTPTPAGLLQLQSAFPYSGFVQSLIKTGPYSVTAGNPVPGGALQNLAVCAATVTTCPTGSPTAEFSTIKRFLPSTSNDQEDIGRLDYQATTRDRFFIRYMFQNSPTLVSGGTVTSGAYYNTTDKIHSVGADWTHTFSPRWLNQLRYGFQQSNLTFGDGGYPNCDDTHLSTCPANITIGTGGFASLGYGFATNIPQGRIVKATQVQDNANFSFGKHAISFGGEFDEQNSPNTFLPNTSGAYTFTNFNYALAGNASLTLANGSPNIPFKEPDVAAYFQDDWRVTPDLTLNLGLRWEFFKQGINVLNQISTARQTGSNPIWLTSLPLSLTTFPHIPEAYKNFEPRIGFAYNPSMLKGTVIRGGFAINFDPAFYNIFLNSYTSAPVVNTGVITCDGVTINCVSSGGTLSSQVHAQADQYNPTGVNPGTKVQTAVFPNFHNPYVENYTLGVQEQIGRFAVAEVRYTGNHAVAQFQSVNANPSIGLAPPTATVPTAQNYMTLAQAFPGQFSATSYCTTAGAVGIGHVDCNRTYVTSRGNTSFSVYNGLQMQIKFADYHGLSGSVAYTWSRTIDNASEVYSGAGGGTTIAVSQSPFNINSAERGVSGDSYPNVTAMGLVYKVKPFEKQNGFVGHVLGGFSFNTVYTFNSGQPYTPYQATKLAPGNVILQNATGTAANPNNLVVIPYANQGQALYSFGDYYYNSGVLGADSERPILANPNAPKGTVAYNAGPGVGYVDIASGKLVSRTTDKWLVSNQYESEALGTPYPGVGRNTLRGNSVNELDFSVFKTVKMTERVSGQLRLNVFNLPNRLYLGTPSALINNAANVNTDALGQKFASFENYLANGGSAVGTPFGKGGRNIQLGGKIIF